MQPDPMEIEAQIAEMLLGMPGKSNEDKYAVITGRFPNATPAQIVAGAEMAADMLEAAAKEYDAQAEAIADEIERRRHL
ncbi:MAG: hypothetical protein Devi2KO_31620 [Devosia indica]